MKQTKKMKQLLDAMAQIARMERGKVCRMGERPHYNHQTWQDGHNIVRYVPAKELGFLTEAIKGYQRFTELAEQYAEEVIKQTRRKREQMFAKPRSKAAKQREPPKSGG